jgi:hypothetical protein
MRALRNPGTTPDTTRLSDPAIAGSHGARIAGTVATGDRRAAR